LKVRQFFIEPYNIEETDFNSSHVVNHRLTVVSMFWEGEAGLAQIFPGHSSHAEPLARAVVEKIYGLRFPLENQERATKAELGRLGASQTDVRPEVDIIVLY